MKVPRNRSNTELALPEIIASKAKANLNPRTDSDLQAGLRPRKPARRRPRTPVLGRLKRGGGSNGRRSRPETPLLKWKVDKSEDINGGEVSSAAADAEEEEEKEADRRDRRRGRRGSAAASATTATIVSARKLAAGLWRLQIPESGGDGKRSSKLGFEYGLGHERVPLTHHRSTKMYGSEGKEYLQSPSSSSRNGYAKVRPSLQLSNSAMEGVTKWDPVGLKAPDDSHVIYRQMKLADQQVSAVTVVAALEAELEQARSRIHELESEQKSSKKKLDHFLRKVSEEKAAWRSREHEKVRMYIDDTKSELSRERKARQRSEVLNSKLVNELADAKLSAKRLLQECEKERKARELIEEVCDELAREIGEDKAEVEALRRDSMRAREEVDDERKMLQMAEVWREERVQMKLVDAKVALEEKYSEMNRLVSDLTRLMNSLKEIDPKEEREAEKLRRVAGALSVDDVKEFSYEPPNPDDIFSVFEEVNFGESGERVRTVSPETNTKHHRDEDESGWETVSHAEEDQGSSFSPESVNNKNYRSDDEEEEEDDDDITEVCSVPAKQFKKGSSIARLWRSRSNNGGGGGEGGRVSNAGTMSPELSPSELLPGQWSSPDSGAGARGINRCIPRPGQKHSLKAKLLEARMESQKVQLRHVLKQKY